MIINSNKIIMGTIIATNIFLVLLSPAFAQLNTNTSHNTTDPSILNEILQPTNYTSPEILTNLKDVISKLPDNIFQAPASESRNTLLSITSSILDEIQNNQLPSALAGLKQLKEKMDGSSGGNPSDDLIIDPYAQKKILPPIDYVISKIKIPQPSPWYTDTPGPGVIYRHYSNFSDFTVHSDLTIEQVKAMRINRINLLESEINSLSDKSFKPLSNDSKNMLLNDVMSARNQIQQDQLLFAISTLQSIAAKMDSSVNGSASDDLIIDPYAQKKILPLLDDIINATKRAAQPSDSVNREPIPIPSPPLMPYAIIGLLIIVNAILGTALVHRQVKRVR